jgi:hypothetical protein
MGGLRETAEGVLEREQEAFGNGPLQADQRQALRLGTDEVVEEREGEPLGSERLRQFQGITIPTRGTEAYDAQLLGLKLGESPETQITTFPGAPTRAIGTYGTRSTMQVPTVPPQLEKKDFTGLVYRTEPGIRDVPIDALKGETQVLMESLDPFNLRRFVSKGRNFESLMASVEDLQIPFDAFSEGVIAAMEPLFPGAGSERAAQSRQILWRMLRGDVNAIEELSDQFKTRPDYQQFLGALIDVGIFTSLAKTPIRAATRMLGRTSQEALENLPESVRVILAKERRTVDLPTVTREGTYRSYTEPSPAAVKAFGLTPIESGLTPGEQLIKVVQRTFKMTEFDPVSTPAMNKRSEWLQNLESIATSTAHQQDTVLNRAFNIDDMGRVLDKNLQGVNPKVPVLGRSDLTEQFGTLRQHMTPDQIEAIEALRQIDEPYQIISKELGIPQTPIEEGGFYLSRGSVVDGEEYYRGGIDKPREFATHGEGIVWAAKEGESYPTFRVAQASRIVDLGKRAIDKHLGDYLKEAVNPNTGLRVASSARDRMPSSLRRAYDNSGRNMRSLRETAKKQTVRVGLLEREVVRGVKATESAAERTIRLEERLTQKGASYTPDDFKNVRDDLTNAIKEVETFGGNVKADIALLRPVKRKLSEAEKSLDKAVDELNEMATEADRFLTVSPATGAKLDIAAATRHIDNLSDQAARLSDDAASAAEKVDHLLERAQISKDLSLGAREEIRVTRRLQRNMNDQNRTVQSLEREKRALDREERRLRNALKGSESRQATAEARKTTTRKRLIEAEDRLNDLRGEYKKWINKQPRGQRSIPDLPNVRGSSFPDEIAKVVNEELLRGKTPQPYAVLLAYNSFYRSVRATADLSAAGIQLLLGLYNSPRSFIKAMDVMFRAIGSERALGAFLWDKSVSATAAGRFTSTEWSLLGLRQGAGDTEFMLGRGIPTFPKVPVLSKLVEVTRLSKLRPIERANRAFGYAGDAMRFSWADDLLAEELAKGRNMVEIRNSGDLERITDFVNNATGWSRKKAFGSYGDLALFAPRFFQSRLTTLAKGTGGLRPGAPIDQRLARRSLVRMIGFGTLLTVGANKMLGEETDFRPFLDDQFRPTYEPSSRMNSNFMRIRAIGRDFSVFGTWDSLLRVMISISSGDLSAPLRTLSSGPVQLAWDKISGQEFSGEEVPDLEDTAGLALWILRSHLPFTAEEAPKIAGQIATGVTEKDPAEVARGVAAGASEVFGIKSKAMTPSEQREAIEAQIMAERGMKGDLNSPEQDPSAVQDVKRDPRWIKATAAVYDNRRGRGSGLQTFIDDNDKLKDGFSNTLDALQAQWNRSQSGTLAAGEKAIFGRGVRNRLSKLQLLLATNKGALREKHKKDLEFFDTLDPPTSREGKAQQAYIDVMFDEKLEDEVTGFYDFDERTRRLEALKDEWGADLIAVVEKTLRDGEPNLVTQLRQDRELLRDYFDLANMLIDGMGVRKLHNEYMETPPTDRKFVLETPEMRPLRDVLLGKRKTADGPLIGGLQGSTGWGPGSKFSLRHMFLVNADPAVDRALLKWGYRTDATHPDVRQEIVDAAVKRTLQPVGGVR